MNARGLPTAVYQVDLLHTLFYSWGGGGVPLFLNWKVGSWGTLMPGCGGTPFLDGGTTIHGGGTPIPGQGGYPHS